MIGGDDLLVPLVEIDDAHDEFHLLDGVDGVGAAVEIRGVKAQFGDIVGGFRVADISGALSEEEQHGLIRVHPGRNTFSGLEPAFEIADPAVIGPGKQFRAGKSLSVEFLGDVLIAGNIELLHFCLL